MTPSSLIEMLISSLNSHTAIRIQTGSVITVAGNDFDEFKAKLDKMGSSIDRAGLYILGDKSDVFRIGEGGRSTKSKDSGTMGHRVFHRVVKAPWRYEIRVALLLPIQPPEFSRLAEQEAFALHFQTEGRLPRYNYAWR